ncbi:hypothetical protein ACQE4N_25835, partial [Klebsiella pneumoniae]
GPDPRNFNQRVSLGRNDLLIRTFLNCGTTFITHETVVRFIMTPGVIDNAPPHPATSGQGHMNF